MILPHNFLFPPEQKVEKIRVPARFQNRNAESGQRFPFFQRQIYVLQRTGKVNK
jgi:hypothetical protein